MYRRLAVPLAALLLAAACGGNTAPPTGGANSGGSCTTPLKFTLRLNWVLDDEQVPYYTALDKGWYKEACLDPQIQAGRGSNDTIQLVANGSADLGIADTVSIVTAQDKGLEVTAIGVIYQHNPTALLVRKATLSADQQAAPKPDLSVLYGKTYGAVIQASPFLSWKALVKQQKIDTSKVRQVTISAPGFTEMATGKVDFIATFAPTAPVLEGLGVPLKVLNLEDYGQKVYGLSFAGNNAFLATHPDAAKAFLKVTQRAIEDTNSKPEEGVKTLCKYNAAICADPSALKTNLQEQMLTIPLYTNLTKGKPMLCGDIKLWRATQDVLRDAETIASEPDPAKSFTNKYLSGC